MDRRVCPSPQQQQDLFSCPACALKQILAKPPSLTTSATDDALTHLQKKHFQPLHTIRERATVQPSAELFFSSGWVRPSTKTMRLSTARVENCALG